MTRIIYILMKVEFNKFLIDFIKIYINFIKFFLKFIKIFFEFKIHICFYKSIL